MNKKRIITSIIAVLLVITGGIVIYASSNGFENVIIADEPTLEGCAVDTDCEFGVAPLGDHINGGITCAGTCWGECPLRTMQCAFRHEVTRGCFCANGCSPRCDPNGASCGVLCAINQSFWGCRC